VSSNFFLYPAIPAIICLKFGAELKGCPCELNQALAMLQMYLPELRGETPNVRFGDTYTTSYWRQIRGSK